MCNSSFYVLCFYTSGHELGLFMPAATQMWSHGAIIATTSQMIGIFQVLYNLIKYATYH